ncbi:hypothetical protein [Aquibium oceanicum]|uniref:Uncharacterized protein n=1 Tax=Aquibium oceanicum TaxID=1670800 RepID=A0A1L3SXU1_9HYPH|nr:hypothetical protein [Aquibium oceanicum]APH74125.1 hypothetical protein BSQ44_24210 [Aquibium oceanicum]
MSPPKVDVYWNTHKRCFSIRPRKPYAELSGFERSPRGRVFYNRGPFVLENSTFHVSQKVRERVMQNKREEVHATIRGTVSAITVTEPPLLGMRVRYNPYENAQFVTPSGRPILKANLAYFIGKEVFVV